MGQRVNDDSALKLLSVGVTKLYDLLSLFDPKSNDLGMGRLKGGLTALGGPNPRMWQNTGMTCA